ncbi:universal stress protein [Paractinoplanes rhizophilus]|jgi:nucleotide-binding universal stress UspA family protein|uniref:Universal stress protein n=1 Tax=Paractinoplanes rhizophilus TaxID=1416877 RepID=A0ABW2I2H8_9ACTN|nr:universal stress protein [Actinoplanes sp.]
MNGRHIVVGVNGKASSTAAVRWAAAEAQLRRVDLHVVLAYQWRIPGRTFTSRGELVRTAGEHATAILHAAVSEARSRAPDIEVRASAVVGEPVPALLEAAAGAGLLVVGGRDRGDPGPMLGVVTSQVAAYAPCSVAVVRPGGHPDTNLVVVGLDDSPAASTTAGAAFEEAARRTSPALHAVTAFTAPRGSDPRTIAGERRRSLMAQLAPWRDKFPEIPVTVGVVHADAATVLVEKSRRAGLVVLGAGDGADFEALQLGPIRLHMLHHAESPVLIARTRD